MLAGFKEFIARGNAVDLAVGVVIGTAFAAVTSSIVDDVLTPLIGGLFGSPDFTDVWHITIAGLADEPAVVKPFAVVTALVNFLLVAGAIYFAIVLPMNRLAARRRVEAPEPAAPTDDIRLLTEIRDLLAQGRDGGPGDEPGPGPGDGPGDGPFTSGAGRPA